MKMKRKTPRNEEEQKTGEFAANKGPSVQTQKIY